MSPIAINILDMVEDVGKESVEAVISDFSTKRQSDDDPLNKDIEVFLKHNALQFAREKKSVTYLVMDEDTGALLGYFTIAHKAIEVSPAGLSKTQRKTVERYAQLHKELNSYLISAFLLAQFGKNYAIEREHRISGDELMKIATKEMIEIQHRIGGGLEYLDCEADAKLIQFYETEQHFRLFGERISEKDGKRYLQYMKFF